MTSFNVRGAAEQRFDAEQFRLYLTVRANDTSAGESIRKGGRSIEQLLQALSDTLHIQPEDIRLEQEHTGSGYGRENGYQREITVSLVMPADLAALHAVTDLLESQADAEYRIDYLPTDRRAAEETVMRAAFADSRAKAEQLAAMLGLHIVSAEKVNYEFRGDESADEILRCGGAPAAVNRLADRLQLPEIVISKSVDITWLAE